MSELDLLGALRDVGAAPVEAPPLSPVFFHRTLARWLGLPEGRGSDVAWQYRVWRADFGREPVRDDGDKLAYMAVLCDDEHDANKHTTVRWWVIKDAGGAIVDAAWHGAPPSLSLLGVDDAPAPVPDAHMLARLHDVDDDNEE